MTLSALSRLWWRALLPASCALCGSDADDALCQHCRQRHLRRETPRCTCCALPLPDTIGQCAKCMAKSCSFEATIVAVDYAAPLDQLVLGLKFGAQLDLAALMARLLAEAVRAHPAFPRPALLVPVPLGRQRLIQRGFNQALEIARPLGRALDIPVTSRLVTRVRETGAQSLLHPDARRRNVAGAFAVLPGASAALYGRHIGVVDDVMTTGETLDALASTLCAAGAASVTNFVFARTLPN